MIFTVFKISLWRLWNSKQELGLALVVPVMFFSIFALIFSRGVGVSLSQIRVSFVDDDKTLESRELIKTACQHDEIEPVTGVWRTNLEWPIEKLSRLLISQKKVEVVVHIPAGFTSQDPENPTLAIQLYNEGTNPIAHRVVQAGLAESIALLFAQANMATVAPQRPATVTASSSDTKLTSASVKPAIYEGNATGSQSVSTEPNPNAADSNPAQVFESIDVFASNKHQPKIALYAAGIAVMFLLFSASGTGASLLEEREAGTLGRLLSSRLSITELLLGKWLFAMAMGTVQLTVMFLWGQLVFDVDLWGHLPGFIAMACATTSACASLAIFLATVCSSRQQLHGVSIILILSMSAIGGSMVPRYVMSDTLKWLGKFTFNGWALDGFQKVFWYDLPLTAIRTELFVLMTIAIVLGAAACCLAQRWRRI